MGWEVSPVKVRFVTGVPVIASHHCREINSEKVV